MSATDLLYLSYTLNKPITYFFPKWLMIEKNDEENLAPLEKELLLHVRRLEDDDLRRFIAQARALVELSERS